MEIVDAQVHVWQAETAAGPWDDETRRYLAAAGSASSASRGSFNAEDLLGEMRRADVDRAVLVPPVFAGDDNTFALDAAARHPDRFAVMGRLPLLEPDPGRLRTWLDQPGMVGVRLTFFYPSHARWLADGTADWAWPVLERLNIPTAVFAPGATAAVGAIAAQHPGLPMVIDHFGIPQRARDDEIRPFVDELVGLAPLENIRVKASALPAHATGPFPFDALHGEIQRVIDAFGPRRVFWGSEMTRLSQPYEQCVRLFTEALTFLSDAELRWIMGDALSEWLGWVPASAR